MDQGIIGGVEGGATQSTVCLLNSEGNVIAKVVGPGTNHFLLGMVEARRRIMELVNQAKEEANVPKDVPLSALGLSLSGCEQMETNQELVRGFLETYPTLSERYAIGSDTQGSISATSNNGGVVCIAGTGSNTLLINPDGSKIQCGGWGNLLGDEGSAWSMSHRAIKICFDDNDGFSKSPYPVDRVLALIKEHFQVKALVDLLEHYYTRFDKAFISALCKKLSVLANDGDPLAIFIFREAGEQLARALSVVISKASRELTDAKGGLHVVCVGSVWFSWNLLKAGFIPYLDSHSTVERLSMVKLSTYMGLGAAYMAADQLHIDLPRTYDKNYEVFYRYEKKSSLKINSH